jgi:hypothetical protein
VVDLGKGGGFVFGGLGSSNNCRHSVFEVVRSKQLEVELTLIVNHYVKGTPLVVSVLKSCLLTSGHLFERQKKNLNAEKSERRKTNQTFLEGHLSRQA